MLWNTDPDTHRSVRSPAFFGPMALAAALTLVSLLQDPLWQQFHIITAHAPNTTMNVGMWGACIKLRNTTGVTGDTAWCTSPTSGFDLYVNLNDTVFYNFPTGDDDNGVILGTTRPSDTIRQVKVLSSSATSLVWIHLIAALVLLATVASLIIPPKWIQGGKSGLAQLQRSGIITLVLGMIGFVLCIVSFVCYIITVLNTEKNFNSIDGIDADWSGTNPMWFVLPSAILMIPAYLSVLLPSYVRPVDQDEVENPMKPLVNNSGNNLPQHSGLAYADSAPGSPDSRKDSIQWGLHKH